MCLLSFYTDFKPQEVSTWIRNAIFTPTKAFRCPNPNSRPKNNKMLFAWPSLHDSGLHFNLHFNTFWIKFDPGRCLGYPLGPPWGHLCLQTSKSTSGTTFLVLILAPVLKLFSVILKMLKTLKNEAPPTRKHDLEVSEGTDFQNFRHICHGQF